MFSWVFPWCQCPSWIHATWPNLHHLPSLGLSSHWLPSWDPSSCSLFSLDLHPTFFPLNLSIPTGFLPSSLSGYSQSWCLRWNPTACSLLCLIQGPPVTSVVESALTSLLTDSRFHCVWINDSRLKLSHISPLIYYLLLLLWLCVQTQLSMPFFLIESPYKYTDAKLFMISFQSHMFQHPFTSTHFLRPVSQCTSIFLPLPHSRKWSLYCPSNAVHQCHCLILRPEGID